MKWFEIAMSHKTTLWPPSSLLLYSAGFDPIISNWPPCAFPLFKPNLRSTTSATAPPPLDLRGLLGHSPIATVTIFKCFYYFCVDVVSLRSSCAKTLNTLLMSMLEKKQHHNKCQNRTFLVSNSIQLCLTCSALSQKPQTMFPTTIIISLLLFFQ